MKLSLNEKIDIIKQGTVLLAPIEELSEKLKSGDILRIKLGADPTAPDLHLGHAVILSKMRQLQDLGHKILFLIGDFTARIGDPTGKSKTRPILSEEQILINSKTYSEQLFRILDKDKTEIVFNSSWLNKLSMIDVVKICAKTTVMQLLEREDFKNRISSNTPVGFHELLYPILQAYDSVELKADIELGGTDQTFNLMFGRHLQSQFEQKPQVVLTMPLLEGLDGKNKMSKSLNNYVGLFESPENAYGKLMSMPDCNLENYNRLLLCKSECQLSDLKNGLNSGLLHPMEEKKKLAFLIIEKFWGREQAFIGQKFFEEVFQNQNYEAVPERSISVGQDNLVWIVDILRQTGIAQSSSEARRLIAEKAVQINNEFIFDFKYEFKLIGGELLKVGKKRFRLIL